MKIKTLLISVSILSILGGVSWTFFTTFLGAIYAWPLDPAMMLTAKAVGIIYFFSALLCWLYRHSTFNTVKPLIVSFIVSQALMSAYYLYITASAGTSRTLVPLIIALIIFLWSCGVYWANRKPH